MVNYLLPIIQNWNIEYLTIVIFQLQLIASLIDY